jgi:hypothetical protein
MSTETETEVTDEYQFEKPLERLAIQRGIPKYLAEGGTIKVIKPPYGIVPPHIVECDIFVPNEGSRQSAPGIKDTKVRIPRPEKKFNKK